MNMRKILLERVIYPAITWIIFNILGLLYAQIITGNWVNLFSVIAPIYYVIFTLFIITWIIIIWLSRKNKPSTIPVGVGSRYGYDIVGYQSFEDVIWAIVTPKKHPLDQLDRFDRNSQHIVDGNPRCPKCGTKLEITKGLIWNNWNCIACDFNKKTRQDINTIHSRVQKIIDRKIEIPDETVL